MSAKSSSPHAPVGAVLFAVLCLLTLIVWGLFAMDRGLWQDDAALLSAAQIRLAQNPLSLLLPRVFYTRILTVPIFALAVCSGRPVVFLHLLYGVTWLATGLLAARIGRQLFRRREVGYLVGTLTVTATSDLLTDSPTATGYIVSTALALGALTLTLDWQRTGRLRALLAGLALLVGSCWMSDVMLALLVVSPLLFALASGWRFGTRERIASATWFLASAPYVAVLGYSLHHSAYAKTAILPLSLSQRIVSTMRGALYNFMPWRWAFNRPPWFDQPAPILPLWLYWLAATVAAAGFLWGARRMMLASPAEPAKDARREGWTYAATIGVLLLCTLLTNGIYAGVQASRVFYRTHLASRVWASLALGAAAGTMARCTRLALLLPAAFVCLGAWGGMERQDYFSAIWRRHRVELSSLYAAAPAIDPGARILLWIPPGRTAYRATTATYLARAWMELLHPGEDMKSRVHQASAWRGSGCVAAPEGLRCWDEGEADCFKAGTCEGTALSYESLVALRFDPDDGAFHLLPALPAELSPAGSEASSRYAPGRLVHQKPLGPMQKHLLAGDRWLGRFLPSGGGP